MNYATDNLFCACGIRVVTFFDNLSRECMTIHADDAFKGEVVVPVTKHLRPFANHCPNGLALQNEIVPT